MKGSRLRMVSVTILCLCGQPSIFSQTPFQNLGFERANVPIIPEGQLGHDVSVADGLPGWKVYEGDAELASMFHNNLSLGAARVSLFGPQWQAPSEILQGRYSVLLQPRTAGFLVDAAIAQTGTIPANAQSIQFYASAFSALRVTFAGQLIPLVQVSATPGYVVAGGDISAFAGQTGELRFAGFGPGVNLPSQWTLLDNITFSTTVVPEPRMAGLLGLGLGLLGLLRWRKSTGVK